VIVVKALSTFSGYITGPMLFLVLILGPFLAVSSAKAVPKFDTAQVHRIYMDGEFEKAIKLVESALASGAVASHEDSVFAFKHLGVMYTAKYETRETGKKYMYQLLYIEPTARIMDMFASDMIYMIFKNIQEEVAITRGRPKHEDQVPDTVPKASPPQKKRTWPYWVGAGVVVGAGLAVTTYLLMDREPRHGTDYVVH
jgi:hypothetical protein